MKISNLYMSINSIGDVISHEKLGPGTWVVVDTKMTGGCDGRDPYSDGYLISCYPIRGRSINNDECKEFYQTGCFIDEVMIPYIKPSRKVKVEHVNYYTVSK